jgi:septum formation protein
MVIRLLPVLLLLVFLTSSVRCFSGMSTLPLLKHRLLLGSSSFSRKQILEEMNLPYTLFVRPLDERAIGSDYRRDNNAERLVSLLAEAKANAVLGGLSQDAELQAVLAQASSLNVAVLVLTADQVCVHEDLGILEKPADETEALHFFDAYRRNPTLLTVGSVRLTHIPTLTSVSDVFQGTIMFNKESLEEDERGRLLGLKKGVVKELIEDRAPVLGCAAGLVCEHPIMKRFISYIDDDSAVRGLKKSSVINLLEEMRVELEKLGVQTTRK